MRHRYLLVAGIALAVAAAATAAIVVLATSGSTSTGSVAAGAAIYRMGTFEGQLIPRTGGSGGGMMGNGGTMGGGMMADGCASCHGVDGHGLSTQTFTAPNITYANLTDPKGMVTPNGSRGPTYADAGIRKAVTQGIDPTGAHLEAPMPQWQLTGQEWADLLAYLKTLH